MLKTLWPWFLLVLLVAGIGSCVILAGLALGVFVAPSDLGWVWEIYYV